MTKLYRGFKGGATEEDTDRLMRLRGGLKSTDLDTRREALRQMKKLEADLKTRQEKRSGPTIVAPTTQTTASNVDASTTINNGGSNQDSLAAQARAFSSPALSPG